MRIAILTGLPSFEPYYSVARCVRDQALILESLGHEATVYVKQGFNPSWGTLSCVAEKRVPGFMLANGRTHEKTTEEFVRAFGGDELSGYDAIFTHDFMFLPSLAGYREGVKAVHSRVRARWVHWSHSVPRAQPAAATAIPGHFYVALAEEHVDGVIGMYRAKPEQVVVVWNPSDVLDTIDHRARAVAESLCLLDTDILGVLPFSIGRLDQKGIHHAVPIYAELSKHWRVRVLLCNSLTDTAEAEGKRAEWDMRMKEAVGAIGPGDFKYFWMSEVNPDWKRWTPNEVVRDLQRLSNLFVYPTIGEGFSLAIGEAMASGGPLCVLPAEAVRGMAELHRLGGVCLLRLRDKPWPADVRPFDKLANAICLDERWKVGVERLRRQFALSRAGIAQRFYVPLLERLRA